jgi:hypothetical protein
VTWKIVDAQGAERAAGQWPVSMAEDSVQKLGVAEWAAAGKGPHELRAEVRDGAGQLISENLFGFEICE